MVDGKDTFMTQRQFPTMALICPRVEVLEQPGGGGEIVLHLSAPNMPDIAVKTPPPDSPIEQIRYNSLLRCIL